MNEYRMKDLKVGMTERFEKVISPEMMEQFLAMTGDENPLHNDRNYAQSQGFRDRVVYGMLTASLISTLGGCYLPGKYCLIKEVEAKFVKPVMVGDTLTVEGKITELYEELKHLVIKVTMRNQNGERVLRGTLRVGVLQ